MDPRSQVLLRQAHHFTQPLLLAGLPPDDLLNLWPQAHGWSWHVGEARQLEQRFGERCSFGITPKNVTDSAAVLFSPKSRELTDYLLHQLAALPGLQKLYLVGEKKAGIERAARQLAVFGQPSKLDSARHCQLWMAPLKHPTPPREPEDWWQYFNLDTPAGPLRIFSLPGVFSHGRLDQGTNLLLNHLHGLPPGRVLDFGCGAGILAASLLRGDPNREVVLLDVDAFALESSRRTLVANGLGEHAQIIAGDGLDDAPRQLGAILSNPPFHQGIKTHYQASEHLLNQAPAHLQPGGELRLVANAHLRYPPLIHKSFGHCQTLASAHGFRIYQARRDSTQ